MSNEFEKYAEKYAYQKGLQSWYDAKNAWDEATRRAQAETVERILQLDFYDEDSIRALSPDPDFLARERLEAKIEDRRGCGLACVDLERELALLSQGAGGQAAMEDRK